MNTVQTNYKQAQIQYNNALAKYESIMVAYEDLLDTDSDKYEDFSMEAEAVSGLETCRLALKSAKQSLIDWGLEAVKNERAYTENKAVLNELIAKMKYRPSIENKVIDLFMRLEA